MKARTHLSQWLFPILSALFCLTLYLLTMAPGLTWSHNGADGGDLVAAASSLGVPHPPGYPTYIALAQAFIRIPWQSPAWRMNLFSACSAAAIAFWICDLISRFRQTDDPIACRVVPVATAIAAGSSSLLWSQAVITEVYTLASLFAVLTMRQAILIRHDSQTGWLWLGIWQSLAILCHPTMLLLLPGVVILVWPFLSTPRFRSFLSGFALGLLPVIYLPLAAARQPATNWGNPSTLAGFIWLTSGAAYGNLAFALPTTEILNRLAALANLVLAQYGFLGTTLAIFGLQRLAQENKRGLAATSATTLAFCIFSVGYNTSDSLVYLLPIFIMESLWIGVALTTLAKLAPGYVRPFIATLCILVVPLLNVGLHYRSNDLSDDTRAIEWYTKTLSDTPANGLILTCDDRHTFALAYAQQSLSIRPDVLVVDADLWQQTWYANQIVGAEQLEAGIAELPIEDALEMIRPQKPRNLQCQRPALIDTAHD